MSKLGRKINKVFKIASIYLLATVWYFSRPRYCSSFYHPKYAK